MTIPEDKPESCAYLCFAHGESDLPSAVIATTREEVLQFLIAEWYGEPPEKMGTESREGWDETVSEFDNHDWREEGPLEWKFEIGGVKIRQVAMPGVRPESQHLGGTPPVGASAAPDPALTAAATAYSNFTTHQVSYPAAPSGGPTPRFVSEADFADVLRGTAKADYKRIDWLLLDAADRLDAANKRAEGLAIELNGVRPYQKEGETAGQCVERNWNDSQEALGLFAKERIKCEALSAKPLMPFTEDAITSMAWEMCIPLDSLGFNKKEDGSPDLSGPIRLGLAQATDLLKRALAKAPAARSAIGERKP